MQALLDRLDQRLQQRSADSPAIALAAEIGVDVGDLFWFTAWVSSDERASGNVPRYQAHVTVDSRRKRWFSVNVTEVKGMVGAQTSFSTDGEREDDLELGRCEPNDLPAWFAAAAKQLGISWTIGIRSNVRGAKRQTICAWLVPK